ncbi:MAG: GxxExxY protein [Gemmataceae bacterium]|nr:GxxExxY protein [Gemmataceae bacterium]
MVREPEKLIYPDECFKIVGACFEVYKYFGCGFLEAVYHQALEIELHEQGIPFRSRKPLGLEYKGHKLACVYVPDLTCYEKIIIELKAVAEIADAHEAQVRNYLKATRYKLGLLVNFGHYPLLQWKRIIV